MAEVDPPAGLARLPWWRLAAYGLPGLPVAAMGLPVYVLLPAHYADDLGLGLATVGAILLLARVWDVVSDPLVGAFADRVRLPFGRRRGLVLAGAPLLAGAAWMLLVPPMGAGPLHLLVWSLLLYLAWTMVQLPHAAWGAELAEDAAGRSRVVAWREGFVIVGTLVAAGVAAGAAGDTGEGLRRLALLLVLALPVALLACLLLVPEPPRPARTVLPWRAGFALLAANRPLRVLLIAFLLNGLANGLPATLFLLYAADVLQAEPWSGALLALYLVTGIAGIPFWLRVSRRTSRVAVWRASMAAAVVVFATAPLMGAGDVVAFAVLCLATGWCLGADLVLPASLQADVAAHDRDRGGGGRTAMVFALFGVAGKLSLALAVGLGFGLLDLAGYEPGSGQGILALAVLYGALPIAFKVAAIGLMGRYPSAARAD